MMMTDTPSGDNATVDEAPGEMILIYSPRTLKAAENAVLSFFDSHSHVGPIPRQYDRFRLGQDILWAIELAAREDRKAAALKQQQ